MLLKPTIIALLFFFCVQTTFSQLNKNRKKITATRTTTPPKIDGNLEDVA